MIKRMVSAFVMTCVMLVPLCGCGQSAPKSVEFTKSDYAEIYESDWPWKPDKVLIRRVAPQEFTFTADGKEYYGNGLTKDEHKYADPHEIWLDDPESDGLKISTSDFIQFSNSFCEGKAH